MFYFFTFRPHKAFCRASRFSTTCVASHWLEFWKCNFLVSPLFFCTPCLVNILSDPWSVTNFECDMGCNAGIVWHKVSQTPVSFHQVNKTDRSTVDNFWKFDFVVSSTSRAVVQVTKSCPNFNNGLSKLKKKNVTGLKLQRKLVIPVSFISYKSFFRLSLFSSPLLLFTCALPSLPSSLSHFVWAFFNITLCSWVNARYTSNMTHFIEIWHQSFD